MSFTTSATVLPLFVSDITWSQLTLPGVSRLVGLMLIEEVRDDSEQPKISFSSFFLSFGFSMHKCARCERHGGEQMRADI